MAIDFPNSPVADETFTSGGTTWIWDGTSWNLYLGGNLVTQASLSSTLSSYALSSSLSGYQELIPYQALPPSTPSSGDYYVNSDENVLYVYDGDTSSWTSLGSTPNSDQAIIASRMFG